MENLKDTSRFILAWIKDNWFKILIILAVAGAFYWYEIRPINIIKECNKFAFESRKGSVELYEAQFDRCIRDRGLKK